MLAPSQICIVNPNFKSKKRYKELKKNLCLSPVVAEDNKLVQDRSLDYFNALKPQDHFQAWITSEVALLTIWIERNERMSRRVRDKRVIHAELFWDDDRKREAMILGFKLQQNPELILDQLKRTPHGCDWLMERWAMLAYSAKSQNGEWNAEQTQLAFDLLGTPTTFREGRRPGVTINYEGDIVDSALNLADVAIREIALLRIRREAVIGLDEINRSLAEADLAVDNDPEVVSLRKESEMLQRRLKWHIAQIKYKSPHEAHTPGLVTRWLGVQEPSTRRHRVPPLPPGYNAYAPVFPASTEEPSTASSGTTQPNSEIKPDSDRLRA